MVIERKISKNKYLLAAILTLLIFFLGLFLGIILDSIRLNWSEKIIKQQEIDYQSLQFQYLYLTELENENASCTVLHTTLDKIVKDLSESLDEFLKFKEEAKINKKEFEIVGRRYLIDNLRYWLFAKKSKKACDIDLVNILYFFSDEKCGICPDQGVILTYFKKRFGEKLLVFPIDVDLEESEPMISILRSQYNITRYPTLIVEGNKFEGIVPRDRLENIICGSFKDNESCA
ncbi:hypothetical protein J4209_05980 [Candidatus Woesearchaeota archaeon]|nr:hypothetical protein [Candidatus Woesearchaeota archaeon]